MEQPVVSKEVATAEINKWLESKKVGSLKREANENQINVLIEAICDGYLSLAEDFTLVHTLKFPPSEGKPLKELRYKNRITLKEVTENMKNVKAQDVDGRILAYASALTGEAKGIMARFDTEDSGILQAIVLFFI